MKKELNPEQVAEEIFNLFVKEIEDKKQFRDAMRVFIETIEEKENDWIEKSLGH